MTADEIIARLQLLPHPKEGGFFRETYRADEHIASAALPDRYRGPRSLGTAIYYLLTPETCSTLHRLRSDEIFHFLAGDPVECSTSCLMARGARSSSAPISSRAWSRR